MPRRPFGGSATPVWLWDAEADAIVSTRLRSSDVPLATYPYDPVGAPNARYDAFGRYRISSPYTLFDSKLIHNSGPLSWDDQETSGSGTSSSHSTDRSSVTIGVGANTAGTRVRQTFTRFNYQPGKSQQIMCTFVMGVTSSGVTKRVGYFNGTDGLFLQHADGVAGFGVRSSTSGSPVDSVTAQASWNIDAMDGAGPSGVTLDFDKAQILFIDFEWLGVGRVRFGFVVDGIIYYCHQELNANNLDVVYMSTPNLPVRYEISNDGTGPADTLEQICSTVSSEGGFDIQGITRAASTEGTHLDADTANTLYALIGIRLNPAHLGGDIRVEEISIISETNDDFEWQLRLNPTVAGSGASAFTYNPITNSCIDSALGITANTVSGGTLLTAGFAKNDSAVVETTPIIRRIGHAIDGTPDELVLCVRPLSNLADYQGAITWVESGA